MWYDDKGDTMKSKEEILKTIKKSSLTSRKSSKSKASVYSALTQGESKQKKAIST